MIDAQALQNHIISLLHTFLKKSLLDKKEEKPSFIVGLSGGADSVFLLRQLIEVQKKLPLQLIVAHLQHDWRGEADIHDAIFCRSLATTFSLPFITATASSITLTKKWNGSLEEHGRLQRHTFLQETMRQQGAAGILLGHQAQDQEETFFIRLLRGSALEGLSGMQPIEGPLIRPILQIDRSDIETWLQQIGQKWCQDIDNVNQRFLRNRIRHEFLPLLRTLEPRFTKTFARTQAQLQQEQHLIDSLVTEKFTQIFDADGKGNLTLFKNCSSMLQGHLLKKLLIMQRVPFTPSQAFLQEALRFISSARGGTHLLTPTWGIEKKAKLFYLLNTSERPL